MHKFDCYKNRHFVNIVIIYYKNHYIYAFVGVKSELYKRLVFMHKTRLFLARKPPPKRSPKRPKTCFLCDKNPKNRLWIEQVKTGSRGLSPQNPFYGSFGIWPNPHGKGPGRFSGFWAVFGKKGGFFSVSGPTFGYYWVGVIHVGQRWLIVNIYTQETCQFWGVFGPFLSPVLVPFYDLFMDKFEVVFNPH